NSRVGFTGDGGPATQARLKGPAGVAVDGAGNLFVADTGNHRVRRVSTSGVIATIAGNGNQGFSGDNGPATDAALNQPGKLAFDDAGNLYIWDFGNRRLRKVSRDGIITSHPVTDSGYVIDLSTVDAAGNVFFTDRRGGGGVYRFRDGTVELVAAGLYS